MCHVRVRVWTGQGTITKTKQSNTALHTTRKIRVVPTALKHTTLVSTNPKTHMASSTFATAIDALVAERDRQFVERICADYNLDFAELHQKYLETAAVAIKVPKKYKKREPKEVKVTIEGEVAPKKPKEPKAKAEKQCCTAQTSKKEPCKFSALKGEVFCKRHLKQSLGETSEPKAKKAQKAAQPVHTHALDAKASGECDLCESHGNPLESLTTEFEMVRPSAATGPVKTVQVVAEPPKSVEDRLAALLAESESESEGEESDSDGEGMASEYEVEE